MAGNKNSMTAPIVRLAKKGDWYSVITLNDKGYVVLRTKDKAKAMACRNEINAVGKQRWAEAQRVISRKQRDWDEANSRFKALEGRLAERKRAVLRAEAERDLYANVANDARAAMDKVRKALVELSVGTNTALSTVFEFLARGIYAAQREIEDEAHAGLTRIHDGRPMLPDPCDEDEEA